MNSLININKHVGELPVSLSCSDIRVGFEGEGLLFVSTKQPVINGEKDYICIQPGMNVHFTAHNNVIFLFHPFDEKSTVSIECCEDVLLCRSGKCKSHHWQTDDKLRIVNEYCTTPSSADLIAKKYSIATSTLHRWCYEFQFKKDKKLYSKHRKCYPEEMIIDIVNEFISGNLSAESVADKYYIYSRTLFNWCKTAGFKKPKNQIKNIIVNMIHQDLMYGFNNNAIQKKYGISKRTLWEYLKIAKSM
ncbi:MAG: hypothetical protein ACI4J1_10660 [Ruminiclostridium sp.]